MHKTLLSLFKYTCMLLAGLMLYLVSLFMADALYTVLHPLHLSLDFFPSMLTYFSLVLVVWLITICIHEYGHFLAARLQGMKVTEVRLVCLVLSARRRGFRHSWKRAPGIVRAWVRATVTGSGDIKHEMMVFILGGPLMNVLVAALCATLVWVTGIFGHVGVSSLFSCLGMANLFTGLVNLLPIGRRMLSDGSRLWYWFFESHKDPENLALLRVMGKSDKGERAREHDPHDVGLLTASSNQVQRFLGGWVKLRDAMDRKDSDSALKIIDEYGEAFSALEPKERDKVDSVWKFFLSENAYLIALHQRSPHEAVEELEAKGREAIPAFMRLRLQAAMHYAEGHMPEAREAATEARCEAEDSYDAGTRLEENDLLDELDAAIRAG